MALALSPIALVFLAPIRARDAGETPEKLLLRDANYVHRVLSWHNSASESANLPARIIDLKPHMSSFDWSFRRVQQRFEIGEKAKGKSWNDLPNDTIVLELVSEDAEHVLGVKNPGLTKDGRLVSRG